MLIKMPKRAALSRSRTAKPRASSPSTCFGTIDKAEWHIDFSLIPKDQRSYAEMKFLAAVRLPNAFVNVIMVYDPVWNTIGFRKQPKTRLDVGDIVR